MKLKDLNANPKNPRIVTDEKLEMLKKSILKFGDLSGIIYNHKTKQLVGGHQRVKILDGPHNLVIAKKYSKPTKAGTVAEGYVEAFGERFVYREVSWTKKIEMAANIAANKGAGSWDEPALTEWLSELALDSDFDMELTMFDIDERDDFLSVEDEDDGSESAEKAKPGISRLEHECPECGHKFTNGDE